MQLSPPALLGNVSVRKFEGKRWVTEWQTVVECTGETAELGCALESRWLDALEESGIPPQSTVFRRVFCSDVSNQSPVLREFAKYYPGAFSAIGQPPLNGAKLVMWSYHIEDPENPPPVTCGGASHIVPRGPLIHAWSTGLFDPTGGNASSQSIHALERLDAWLSDHHLTLEENVIRTWWFVRDIDSDYQALVEARKAYFEKHGLTEDTHYIASTGIAGAHGETSVRLSLDTYAIGGLVRGQVEHLCAPDHLGPTHRYGVTFERATSVSYSDRKHVFISGTASIDPSGDIVHPGDVVRQLDRALENVSALLATAGAGLPDLGMIIVYLRDPADGALINAILKKKFPDLPMVLVHAPVCRPGWLVEVEGVACIAVNDPDLPDF